MDSAQARMMLDDIQAMLRFVPEGPLKDEIWGRYGAAIKDKVAAMATANGWTRQGGDWIKAD